MQIGKGTASLDAALSYFPALTGFATFLLSSAHHLAAGKKGKRFCTGALSLPFAGTKYISMSGTICAIGTDEKMIASVDISAEAGVTSPTAAVTERTTISLHMVESTAREKESIHAAVAGLLRPALGIPFLHELVDQRDIRTVLEIALLWRDP